MSADHGSERTAECIDRFDFERLEASVESLLHDHERLSTEQQGLLAELADREHRIAGLQRQLDRERALRLSALEGVERLIARVESMQARVDRVVDARAAGETEDVNP